METLLRHVIKRRQLPDAQMPFTSGFESKSGVLVPQTLPDLAPTANSIPRLSMSPNGSARPRGVCWRETDRASARGLRTMNGA